MYKLRVLFLWNLAVVRDDGMIRNNKWEQQHPIGRPRPSAGLAVVMGTGAIGLGSPMEVR